MADTVTQEARSRIMSRIRSRDTTPEIAVRSFLHRAGLRFRVQRTDLPGRPDIVLTRYRSVVFVHGCFWHLHGCSHSSLPKTRRAWWRAKLFENRRRDRRNVRLLRKAGWRVYVVWECGIEERNLRSLIRKIRGGLPYPSRRADHC